MFLSLCHVSFLIEVGSIVHLLKYICRFFFEVSCLPGRGKSDVSLQKVYGTLQNRKWMLGTTH